MAIRGFASPKVELFHSVRINDQWRIVFRWTVSGPIEVDVRDYH
jgi:plasmid maintenance system killer protein